MKFALTSMSATSTLIGRGCHQNASPGLSIMRKAVITTIMQESKIGRTYTSKTQDGGNQCGLALLSALQTKYTIHSPEKKWDSQNNRSGSL
jgi:hypothetical protein